ncbi:hypothetical protein B0J11DRAFT_539834 [Dendryphion nanum]|uniref:F-box domain-containing protein n=1 Tax=Dendryphion nanum TaxID=256645 RepID=A0A9P9D7F7_9PLEO|nr:hypothetical protein B0J11DRAFT_539834 [Dendryphion nanum]
MAISDLPTELLLHISSYLSPSATGCFALTNRRFYTTAKLTDCHDLKKRDIVEHANLLSLLAKDHPDKIHFCQSCSSLHNIRSWTDEAPSWNLRASGSEEMGDERVRVEIMDDEFDENGPQSQVKRNDIRTLRQASAYQLLPQLEEESSVPAFVFSRPKIVCRFGFDGETSSSVSITEMSNSLFDEDALSEPESDNNRSFTATYFLRGYACAQPYKLRLDQKLDLRIVFSKPISTTNSIEADDAGLNRLRIALEALDLHCCPHCAKGGLSRQFVCRVRQNVRRGQPSLSGREGVDGEKACRCVLDDLAEGCVEHRSHTDVSKRGCGRNCTAITQIRVYGGCTIDAFIWRGWCT